MTGTVRLAWIALFALALSVCLGKAWESTLKPIDSAIHASIALKTTDQGLRPHLPMSAEGAGGYYRGGFNDHPFLTFWLSGQVMRALGADAWSARLLPALFGAGCVLLTALLGQLLFSRVTGFVAGLTLALSLDFFRHAATFQLDTGMLFFLLLSFVLWRKGRFTLAGAAAGLGVLMKTPVALLIFPAVLGTSALTGSCRRDIPRLARALAATLAVVAAFWALTARLGGTELVRDYWLRQVLGTLGGRGEGQSYDPWMFFRLFTRRYLPWNLLALSGLAVVLGELWRGWPSRRRSGADAPMDLGQREARLLPILAAAIAIVVISAMRFKSGGHYFLAVYPFLAILGGYALEPVLRPREPAFLQSLTAVVLLLVAFLLNAPVRLAPEAFPALRRFLPLIQSYGSCASRVLFVEGQQPYGSRIDYGPLVHFYADREFEATDCAGAEAAIARAQPDWVIVSGVNLTRCLSPTARAQLPTHVRYGNQHLLSRALPWKKDGVVDLTALERELRPAVDCRPAPISDSGYFRAE